MIRLEKLIYILISLIFLCGGCSRGFDEFDNDSEGAVVLSLTLDKTVIEVTKAAGNMPVPELKDFTVQIVNAAGTVLKEWESYETVPERIKIQTGQYTLRAFCGNSRLAAFDKPYFEGTADFSVQPNQTRSLDVICRLANVKVDVAFKEGFKKYFTDYNTKVVTTGDTLTYVKGEVRSGYVEAGDLAVKVTMTKQNGTVLTYDVPVFQGACGPENYILTFDVEGGAGGNMMTITFSDNANAEPIQVDLSQDWIPNAAPFITPTGFANGEPVEIFEGEQRSLSLLGTVRNKISSCVITTSSPSLIAAGWPATVDLVDIDEATKTKLKGFGFKWTEGLKGIQMAILDFTKLVPQLTAGTLANQKHEFQVELTDAVSQKNHPFSLVLDVRKPTFNFLEPDPVFLNATYAVLTLGMPTGSISNVKLKYRNEWGMWKDCDYTIQNTVNGVYTLKANIPFKNRPVTVQAVDSEFSRTVETEVGVRLSQFELKKPARADIWPREAYLVVLMQNGANADEIRLEQYQGGNSWTPYTDFSVDRPNSTATSARLKVTELQPGKTYTFRANYGGGEQTTGEYTVVAETDSQLPNAGFEYWTAAATWNMNNGGKQSKRTLGIEGTDNPRTVDVSVYNPMDGWCTVNDKTAAYNAASNKNAWYIVPSTGRGGYNNGSGGLYAAVIQNVGWHNAGGSVPNNTSSGAFTSYPGSPTELGVGNVLKSVGKLFLGSYSATHGSGTVDETYTYGVVFESRPKSIGFTYSYTPVGTDNGYVRMELVHRAGNTETIVATATTTLGQTSGYQTISLPFTYKRTDMEATHIKVMFASSDKLSENQSSENSSGMSLKAQMSGYPNSPLCYTGSELRVDDVKLVY